MVFTMSLTTLLMGLIMLKPSSAAVQSSRENACCAAILLQDTAVPLAPDGTYLLPPECRDYGVSCNRLGFSGAAAADPSATNDADEVLPDGGDSFFEYQAALRENPGCDAREWSDRCPPASTMLLAATRRGCLSAGCVAVDGGCSSAVQVEGLDEDVATLVAVTAQETAKLEASSSAGTFHKLSWAMRKSFVKEKKHLLRQLNKKLKTSTHATMDGVRSLLEQATRKGFVGRVIDEARMIMTKHDAERSAHDTKMRDMEMTMHNLRTEASSLAEVIEEQRRAAFDEDERSETDVQGAIQSRDDALRQAATSVSTIADLEAQASTEARMALSIRTALESELGDARRAIWRKHQDGVHESETFVETTDSLQKKMERLTESIVPLSEARREVGYQFLSEEKSLGEVLDDAHEKWEAQQEHAGLLSLVQEEERLVSEGEHEAVREVLHATLESRDAANAREASAAGMLSACRRRAVSEAAMRRSSTISAEVDLERARVRWRGSRADVASSVGIMAREEQEASMKTAIYAATLRALSGIAQNVTKTISFLRGEEEALERNLTSSKDACQAELATIMASRDATDLSNQP